MLHMEVPCVLIESHFWRSNLWMSLALLHDCGINAKSMSFQNVENLVADILEVFGSVKIVGKVAAIPCYLVPHFLKICSGLAIVKEGDCGQHEVSACTFT